MSLPSVGKLILGRVNP